MHNEKEMTRSGGGDSEYRLGALLKERREDLNLSFGKLQEKTGISKGQLYKLETVGVQKPPAHQLKVLADALELPFADLYTAAGLPLPAELPSFTPYMRSKYSDLPTAAIEELDEAFRHIATKHGYDSNGPQPGEDEN